MVEKVARDWELVRRHPKLGDQVMMSGLTYEDAARRADVAQDASATGVEFFARKRG